MNQLSDIIDDKTCVIFALLVIAIIAMLKLPDPGTIISSIVSGLLGVAVGKQINGGSRTVE